VRIHLPQRPTGAVRWYKLDPATGHLFELPGAVTFDGSTALLELTDGGIGDFDGVVNGVIIDPSGPLTIPSSGGSGGSTAEDSGSSSFGWFLPAMLGGAALARRRRTAGAASAR
jgi:MYXO-CTERM domain-containing protein